MNKKRQYILERNLILFRIKETQDKIEIKRLETILKELDKNRNLYFYNYFKKIF